MRMSGKKEKSSAVHLFYRGMAMVYCGIFILIANSFSQQDSAAAAFAANYRIMKSQLNGIIDEAIKNNPRLKAAGNKIDAAKASEGYCKES